VGCHVAAAARCYHFAAPPYALLGEAAGIPRRRQILVCHLRTPQDQGRTILEASCLRTMIAMHAVDRIQFACDPHPQPRVRCSPLSYFIPGEKRSGQVTVALNSWSLRLWKHVYMKVGLPWTPSTRSKFSVGKHIR
jgi:hypothetical protein